MVKQKTRISTNLKLVLAADFISKSGDWMLFVALNYVLFTLGGVFAVGIYSGMRVCLPIFAGPIAGRILQSANPKIILVRCDYGRAVFTAAATLVTILHASVWILQALALAVGLISAIAAPTERRLHRITVEEDWRSWFNSVLAASGTIIMTLAGIAGGLLLQATNSTIAIALDSVTFLISARLIKRLRVQNQNRESSKSFAKKDVSNTVIESHLMLKRTHITTVLRSVFAPLLEDSTVLYLCVTQFFACFIAGSVMVSLAPMSFRLHLDSSGIGWFLGALGFGSFLGSLGGGWLSKHRRIFVGMLCITVTGMLECLLVLADKWLLVICVLIALGFFANLPEPLYWSEYMSRVKEESTGIFYGLVESAIGGGFALGGLTFGLIAARNNLRLAEIVIGSSCAILVGLLICASRILKYRAGERISKQRLGL